jgi:hypothetical protein
MSVYEGPEDSLSRSLWLMLDDYRSARGGYASEAGDEGHLMMLYDLIAEALLKASADLVFRDEEGEEWKPAASPWDAVVKIAEKQGFKAHLAQSVEICIADDAIARLEASAQRCLELANLILSREPSEPVRRYLARLGRCYIAGFLPECVILCRAVLENAVVDVFARHNIPLPATDEGKSSMKSRLNSAQVLGWLSESGRRNAETIWQRGNVAVHHDPEATSDVLGTLSLTFGVLEELYA